MRHRCHDCGVFEGDLHDPGCDVEECPACGGQAISCGCKFQAVKGKRRIPYIRWPNICARCGALYPELFMVPDEEWKRFIAPRHRRALLCRRCYDIIKRTIIRGAAKAEKEGT